MFALDVLLHVLLIIQKLLQENRHASKRDIYYMHPGLFLGDFNIMTGSSYAISSSMLLRDVFLPVLIYSFVLPLYKSFNFI